jgi:DNA-binding NtrC family response regulator
LESLKLKVDSSDDRFVAKDHSSNVNEAGSTTQAAATRQGKMGRRRSAILIVADESDAMKRFASSLSSCGYLVDVAHDQATVARLAGDKEFDVVVNDIDMHGCCDGELLRDLRRQNQRVPVVVLTEYLGFASARAALDCGAHKYLVKPVSEDRLLQVLIDAIGDVSRLVH